MADCVVCSYPMIHVGTGTLGSFDLLEDPKAKEAMEKHDVQLKEGEIHVGCYVCPECGHCTWLEEA